jgi:hypothetical protein
MVVLGRSEDEARKKGRVGKLIKQMDFCDDDSNNEVRKKRILSLLLYPLS